MKIGLKNKILIGFLLLFNVIYCNAFAITQKNKNSIPIFFASNEKYAPYVAVSMASILYNTDSHIDFYIIDGGIKNSTKKLIKLLNKKFDNFSLEFIKIDTEEEFENFKDNITFGSLDIYSRFLIPTMKPNIDKVIYLDADTVVLDDIYKLYNENIDDYYIGAVAELTTTSCPRNIGIPKSHKYFNSGVLLINSKKWREDNIKDKLFEIGKKYSKLLAYPDQDILNKAFENNNYKILDYKYNASEGTKKSSSDDNIIVRHYTGTKPDNLIDKYYYDYNYENINEFWFYAQMTPFYAGLQNYYTSIKIDRIERNIVIAFEDVYLKSKFDKRKIMYYSIGITMIISSLVFSAILLKILIVYRKKTKKIIS